jgi:hypothetical protein
MDINKKKKNIQLRSKTSTPIKYLNDRDSTKINPLTVIDEYIRQSNIYGETKTIISRLCEL